MTKKAFYHQPRYYTVPLSQNRIAEAFETIAPEWSASCVEAAQRSRELGYEFDLPPRYAQRFRPRFTHGVVLAGAKLLENGGLPQMRAEFHDKVKALEMEGAGFAAACGELQWPWLVLRGVADYGGEDRQKNWQGGATIAAGQALRWLLERDLLALPRLPLRTPGLTR